MPAVTEDAHYLPFVLNGDNDCHYTITSYGRAIVSRCLDRWSSGARWIREADIVGRCHPLWFTTGPWGRAEEKKSVKKAARAENLIRGTRGEL